MGYFNYFIKCIIRNIAYRLCKPKVLLTIFLAVAILFGLKHFGYCALDDTDYEMIADGFATITQNQSVIISQLSSMGVDVSELETKLSTINTTLNNIKVDTNLIVTKLDAIMKDVDNLNTNILNIYNKLDTNQKELITELQTENEKVLTELEEIKKVLTGVSEESSELFLKSDSVYYYLPNPNGSSVITKVYSSNPGNAISLNASHFQFVSDNSNFFFEKGYTYNVTLQIREALGTSSRFYYTYDTVSVDNEIKVNYLGNFTQSSLSFSISPVRDGVITFLMENNGPFWQKRAYYTITKVPNGSLSSIGDNLNNVNDSINQGNQLQQEQNQLQQEQNEILTDDNVDTEGLEFATDDTVNPTTDGFNTLFNTVYNAFCNTSSEPLTITLPYINETFTIQPNVVSNGMQKAGLGVVVSLINSFYYFSVCLFIYKDIAKIVDNLKSGNITSDCGNVKTEVL